jgi:zinc-binding alcohol dehydrogenase/oxidoreductase
MKAAVLKQTGNSLKQNIAIEDIPQPEITDEDEVIVKIKCASLNHRDIWIARGKYSKIVLPAVLGSDASGIVYEKGNSVVDFKTGDEVVINPNIDWGSNENFQSKNYSILGMPSQGTFAEFVKVKSDRLKLKPEHLSHSEASAIPLAGLTAYRSLFNKGNFTGSENILITGIGGGVAVFILTFAVSCGAKAFVTSGSDEKINKAVKLGAVAGANYNDDDWGKEILELSEGNIELIFDSSAGDTINESLELVNYGGKIILYGATLGKVNELNAHRIFWKQVSITGSTMSSDAEFIEMVNFIDEKKIKPVIDSEFDLEIICDAFERMSAGDHFGKVVIKVG